MLELTRTIYSLLENNATVPAKLLEAGSMELRAHIEGRALNKEEAAILAEAKGAALGAEQQIRPTAAGPNSDNSIIV